MELEDLNIIKNRDVFNKENNFLAIESPKSILIWGRHAEIPPFITIIMPTYKRSDLIVDAIESVLEQKDFEDYQLLIIDNEGCIGEETDTERVIKNINSDKIIYYKNEKNIGGGSWNRCIELAQSEWLCMLHDDDLLVEKHLKLMTDIIKNNPRIKFLSCQHKGLDERKIKLENVKLYLNSNNSKSYGNKIKYISYTHFKYGMIVPFLGSLFKRSCAKEIGGFSVYTNSCMEDFFFMVKYAYYFGLYQCPIELYGYRWRNNDSIVNSYMWQNLSVHEYYGRLAIINKEPNLFSVLLRKYNKYAMLKRIDKFIAGTSFLQIKCSIDRKEFCKDIEIKNYRFYKIASIPFKVFKEINNWIDLVLCYRKNLKIK